jgi:hypothetical protein
MSKTRRIWRAVILRKLDARHELAMAMMLPFAMPLLTAMVRLDAEALVMADGSIPVIVGAGGRRNTGGCRNVGTRRLPRHALVAVLKDLLPIELQCAFDDLGAIKFAVPELPAMPGQRFTVLASIGDRLRVEIRRDRAEEALELPPIEALWPGPVQRPHARRF